MRLLRTKFGAKNAKVKKTDTVALLETLHQEHATQRQIQAQIKRSTCVDYRNENANTNMKIGIFFSFPLNVKQHNEEHQHATKHSSLFFLP